MGVHVSEAGELRARLTCPDDFSLVRSQSLLLLGSVDPWMKVGKQVVWRATRSPLGPATYALRRDASEIVLDAWGSGAPWVVEHARGLIGLEDDPSSFCTNDARVREYVRQCPGLYLPKSLRVFEHLFTRVLLQLVTFREARRAMGRLLWRFGEDAPGPMGLRLLPGPKQLASIAPAEFVPLGVLARQARTLHEVARAANRLEEIGQMPRDRAAARLQSIRGIGPWTAEYVFGLVLGDADAVPVADYHLPNEMCWALAGERNGSDARMLELLEPFSGHRFRVINLVRGAGVTRERRGPRRPMRRLPGSGY